MGKQVKTPRFYVDMPTFLHATGQLGWDGSDGGAELLYMNCANPYIKNTTSNLIFKIGDDLTNNTPKTSFPINFCALLNHNLASDDSSFTIPSYRDGNASHNRLGSFTGYTNVLNSSYPQDPQYNGTSIFTFSDKDGINDYWKGFGVYFPSSVTPDDYPHQLGSLVVGKYFDCPNSPDLNLTMSRRFDGIKSQKTIGGKTLSNIYYDGPTEWTMNNADGTNYKYPPFELDTTGTDFNERAKSGLGRKGLRSWKLSFSYIAESDMWMENEVSNTLISDGETNPALNDSNPMLSDNSFNFVWNCTLGGTLPFIFQPDNTNNNPDQFSICTFRENTFSVQQQAHNVYKVSMTIDELA